MKPALTNLLFLFFTFSVFAQNDCPDAIIVCGNNNYSNLNATGVGIQELTMDNACHSVENNSLWLKLLIKDGGTLGFILTPENTDPEVDFDFWLFGPNVACGDLGTAIRCSTTNPGNAELTYNTTGMDETETDTSEGPGELGNAFINWITASDDDTYYLVIDRPHGAANFSIEWTGTATFHEVPVFYNPDNIPLDIVQCDDDNVDDNSTAFDLTIYNEMFIGPQTDVALTFHNSINDMTTGENPIAAPQAFVNTQNPQTIYLRMTNTVTGCFANETFTISLDRSIPIGKPQNLEECDFDENGLQWFDLTVNDDLIKEGNTTAEVTYYTSEEDALNHTNPVETSYLNTIPYQTQTIWAKIDNTEGCFAENITTFTVGIIPLKDMNHSFKITDFKEHGNSIEVIMEEQGENLFEYSMDGALFTASPYFGDLDPGVYTVYIRSTDLCKTISEEVVILDYPKFFTPNLDGIHEYWNIYYISHFPNARISIFDRYGKLVNSYFGYEMGWDGYYNGKSLPSTDYWFRLDFDSGRAVKGHFSLVR
ncbi:T9SS type B sorting domain-containing protein [Flavobacterium rhizosphaerae]|uniref:T9SS type B sorting domain-containing protein n=1 Tax=Flavobacterium rhizosphaerae TaxID=3163298 RepID=A0ABW8YVP6_9FLAO